MNPANPKQQPRKTEGAPEASIKLTTAIKEHSVTETAPMAQDCSQEMDTCDQNGGSELFDEGDFITMSDSLPEMDMIFENVYVM
ncbi:MAG: hypothetical protein M1568_03325 [Acidobacteria bacterium]|jgi:hypothetical protein|nr:hypothetical protein [Acidobacteriota bacterium]